MAYLLNIAMFHGYVRLLKGESTNIPWYPHDATIILYSTPVSIIPMYICLPIVIVDLPIENGDLLVNNGE